MNYEWLCENCNTVTEVERRLEDYKIPPDKCKTCGRSGNTLIKTITSPPVANRTLAWGRKGRWNKDPDEP
jgi:hypothetical protein